MTIKSILVEVEDENGDLKKVLFGDFVNIIDNTIDIHTKANYYDNVSHNKSLYPSRDVDEYDIKINLKCREYTLTEMKGE